MASGTITLVNDTSMEIGYNITENGSILSNMVASGIISANGKENVPVSGYDLYQVNFYSMTQAAQTEWGALNVAGDSQVTFIVSSDPGVSSGE
ncbi:MAG: hypothetical protein WCF57_06295 [Pyrinomonadaceae bacterium]